MRNVMGGEEGGGAYSRNPTIALDVRDEGARGKEDFFFFFFDKVLSFSLSLVINQQVFSFFHSLSIHILLNPSLPFSTFPPPSLYPSLSLSTKSLASKNAIPQSLHNIEKVRHWPPHLSDLLQDLYNNTCICGGKVRERAVGLPRAVSIGKVFKEVSRFGEVLSSPSPRESACLR